MKVRRLYKMKFQNFKYTIKVTEFIELEFFFYAEHSAEDFDWTEWKFARRRIKVQLIIRFLTKSQNKRFWVWMKKWNGPAPIFSYS